jgi:flagellar basal-body rod protein FlgG
MDEERAPPPVPDELERKGSLMTLPIDTSRAAMLRQQTYLDTVAHNIANVNTAGFKATYAALESGGSPQATDPAETPTSTDTPPLTGQVQTNRRFTQGPLRETGVPTDFAIDGDGFFVLQASDGTTTYTRNGSFRLDSTGQFVDAAGRLLQPPIGVPQNGSDLRVAGDGTVSALLPGTAGRQTIGQIQLATFSNPNGLLAGADGTYTPTAASGPARLGTPGQGLAGTVRNGTLEGANTDVTEQMTSLLAAQRLYQLNTSAFRMDDQLLGMADQLGSGAG